MSVFTEAEIEYLNSQRLGRMATVGADGQPHIIPVTFVYNAAEDAVDIGGLRFGAGKKWRDAQQNPRVTGDCVERVERDLEYRLGAELRVDRPACLRRRRLAAARPGVVEAEPGLYFVGLPFLFALTSSLVGGVGRDAEYIATHIAFHASGGATEHDAVTRAG